MRAGQVALFSLVPAGLVACGLTVVGQDAPSELGEDGGREAAPPLGSDTGSPVDSIAPDAGSGVPVDAPFEDVFEAGPTGPTTSVGTTTLDPSNLMVDCVRPTDGAIASDGAKDGIFDVEVTGPAIAMALILTDGNGAPFGAQQWDTWVGTDMIPPAIGTGFMFGGSTYQLGVQENGAIVNDANGRLTLPAGTHTLRLCATNVGSFFMGSHFRVVVEDPQEGLVYGPVLTY